MADALQYLTVQDVLWINLQVTGSPQKFAYADLEEAVYYQYGYGESKSLLPQAARLLTGFLKKKPFAAGNEATAFVGCLSFLLANGVALDLDDPVGWFRGIENGTHEGLGAISAAHSKEVHLESEDHHEMVPEVRTAVTAVLTRYAEAVAKLGAITA